MSLLLEPMVAGREEIGPQKLGSGLSETFIHTSFSAVMVSYRGLATGDVPRASIPTQNLMLAQNQLASFRDQGGDYTSLFHMLKLLYVSILASEF